MYIHIYIYTTQWVITQEDVVRQIVESVTNDSFHVWMSAVSCNVLQRVAFQRSAVSSVVTQSWRNKSRHRKMLCVIQLGQIQTIHFTYKWVQSWVKKTLCIGMTQEFYELAMSHMSMTSFIFITQRFHGSWQNESRHNKTSCIKSLSAIWMSHFTYGWDVSSRNE